MERWRVLLKMYTKRINYISDEIKEKFEMLRKENNVIGNIIFKLIGLYPEGKLKDINVFGNNYIINILGHTIEIEVTIDKYGNIDNISYLTNKEEFKNNNTKVIAQKYSMNVRRYEYINEEKNLDFNITISDFDESTIGNVVSELLDENHVIRDIKDIYYAIANCINIDDISLIIKSVDEKSFLELFHGIIMKYQNVVRNGNRTIREYLEDGKYYVDEMTTKEMFKDNIPFVKTKVR